MKNPQPMIRSELYYHFRGITNEDYSEQIKFYEKHISLFEDRKNFEFLRSRNDFIQRIFILFNCAVAYNKSKIYDRAVPIFDLIIDLIESNHQKFNLDLKREHYFIDSLFEKGKALYNLSKFAEAEKSFKTILDTGYAYPAHINWYAYSRNSILFNNFNFIFLGIIIGLSIIPDLVFTIPRSTAFGIAIINMGLLVIYFLNPSKILSKYFAKKYAKEYQREVDWKTEDITYYTVKIQKEPNDYLALTERGIIHNFKDDYENSLLDLNNALSIAPNNPDALYYRADAYSSLNRHEEAIKDLTRLIELKYPHIEEFYESRGYSYMALKKFDLALSDFNKAIELDPYSASYLFNRAYWL